MNILAVTCENLKQAEMYKEAGADEVILALKDSCFSPLVSFELSEITDNIDILHQAGLRVSVLMNRLFHETTAAQAIDDMKQLIKAGADGIVYADPALLYGALKEGLEEKLIYQPETMMTSSFDAETWSAFGRQAVMISALLTEQEILNITSHVKNAGMNIHGWQLMSVSGRPLLSAYAHTRGLEPLKNRKGLTLVEAKREGHMPVYENDYSTMIFSDYVLESFDECADFMKAGMKRFTVDSWNLDTRAVIDALRLYRSLLDGRQNDAGIQEYRETYKNIPLSKGYYDQKTVR